MDNNIGWHNVDDRVMGGRSQSYFCPENDYIKFYGNLNLNGGGFCNLTSANFNKEPVDLSQFAGIAIDVSSEDCVNYKFNLTERDGGWNRPTWAGEFEVTPSPNNWTTVHIPFDKFIPTWRGQLTHSGKMDLTNVNSLSIQYSKFGYIVNGNTHEVKNFKEGKFELKFKNIRGYGSQTPAERDANMKKLFDQL
jgi:hypothetical protein